MTSLSFYGGAHELGGTQVLLDDNGVKIFLDFGLNFTRSGNYFLYPNAPKKFNALQMLLAKGVYPDLPGMYRPDHLRQMGRGTEAKDLDAILITHAHLDHVAGINFIRPDVDVWMDPMTKAILYSLQMFSGIPHQDFVELNWLNEIVPNIPAWNSEYTERILSGAKAKLPRRVRTFIPPEPFYVGHVKVEPFYVDHSLPGSTAFLLHTSAGTIAYTGDIRLSGRRGRHTEQFIEAAHERGVDYLLCEGSLIDRKHPGTEDSLVGELTDVIKHVEGLVAISYPPRDIDRIASLHRVARKSGRTLVIDAKQAQLLDLETFKGTYQDPLYGYPHLGQKNIAVYMPRKGAGMLTTEHDHLAERDYFMWERKFLRRNFTITADDLRERPGEFIWYFSPANQDDLLEVQPPPGSLYIRSNPAPYTPEMELGQNVLMNWLSQHNLLADPRTFEPLHKYGHLDVPTAHVTGHMSYDETRELVRGINPKTLIPIHTALMGRFLDIYRELGQRVAFVERNERLELLGNGDYRFLNYSGLMVPKWHMETVPEALAADPNLALELGAIDFHHADR